MCVSGHAPGLYTRVYKRMCNFERAARYDRLWRLCPPLPKQPKGAQLAAVAASNAAAAERFHPRALAGTETAERAPAAALGLLLSQKLHPHQRHQEHQQQLQQHREEQQQHREEQRQQQQRQYSKGPASPTGSVASELADPLLGHFSGDLQERVAAGGAGGAGRDGRIGGAGGVLGGFAGLELGGAGAGGGGRRGVIGGLMAGAHSLFAPAHIYIRLLTRLFFLRKPFHRQ